MKREIKFRAKPFGRKDFVYGSLNFMPWIDNKKGAYFIFFHEKHEPDNIEVDPDTVGQFTGIKDAEGNGIYEGDILHSFDSQGFEIRHVVVWEDAGFRLNMPRYGDCGRLKQHWIDEYEKKVIGNVHDNKDLLTEKGE